VAAAAPDALSLISTFLALVHASLPRRRHTLNHNTTQFHNNLHFFATAALFVTHCALSLNNYYRRRAGLSPFTFCPRVTGAPSSFSLIMSNLSIISEDMSMDSSIYSCDSDSPPTLFLVQDFGWPRASPRHRGDHTQQSNPDWEHDPMACAKAKKEAMKKMEVSYALYMANMGQPVAGKKASSNKDKDGWIRYVMPWKWTARREAAAF
jgi:hypothetical protein